MRLILLEDRLRSSRDSVLRREFLRLLFCSEGVVLLVRAEDVVEISERGREAVGECLREYGVSEMRDERRREN